MIAGLGDAPPQPFDLAAPLPAGITLLEASAGTGKTTTIANLAVRYLAEGTPIDQLLVVTFTRSATGELRERVRDRLVAVEAGLRAPDAHPDELVALLASGGAAEVERRHRRLAAALADFDAATISTIHGFCEQVLAGLGTAADSGRDLRFVEDGSGTVDEVVDDLYLRKFRDLEAPPAFPHRDARQVVDVAVRNRDAHLEPAGAAPGSAAALRASLAARGRDEVIRRSRRAGTVGWDDQIARLAATLHGRSGSLAVARLRARYSVVLVDEFQDTDQTQWDIFRTAFGGGGVPLLLIGDPKQAIYSFRGGDVWTYLAAAATAGDRCTLGTNWRSDQPLLDALDALMAGATLGHPDIPYRTVTAAPGHGSARLVGAPQPAPLRLRLAHRGDGLLERTPRGWAQADSARSVVAADLADDIVDLVSSGATLQEGGRCALVSCAHLAVLVRTNHEATTIHRALDRAGVPAVIAGGGSVFATPAASHWLTLLEALEQPAATGRARAASLTPFVGWDPATLVAAGDGRLDALQSTLHRWAAVLADHGVAALAETVSAEEGLMARELALTGGERRLTDLRHVAELLHAEALASGAGGRALTSWLRTRIRDASTDAAADERSRRLESDAAAVQIQTVHRSKGLEHPIVYLPYLWHTFPDRDTMPLYHDPQAGDRRTIDVGGDRPDEYARHRAWASEERRGEDLRQAYVAFTRARHQVVAWWVTGYETSHSPLARLLLGRGPDGSMSHRPAPMPADDDVVEDRMRDLAARAGGTISVERVGSPSRRTFRPEWIDPGELAVGVFARDLDVAWRRASYTGITAAAHGRSAPAVASEAEGAAAADEPLDRVDGPHAAGGDFAGPVAAAGRGGSGAGPGSGSGAGPGAGDLGPAGASAHAGDVLPDEGAGGRVLPSPMADLPAGAGFGIVVHAVCEAVDFAAPDLDAALAAAVADVTGRRAGHAGDPGVSGDPTLPGLARALVPVLETPLGPLVGDRRLRDVPPADRLDELSFELPLAGGDRPGPRLAVDDIAACLRRHLPSDDPFAGYPDRLADPALAQVLRGFLTGSIDLVLRVPGGGGPRFVVVDYKTNWLGPAGEPLTTWHYRPARMVEAMVAEHYPLQAVLYSVALHRYLRWRLAGYDPGHHLGGVLYLFLRGMAGAGSPVTDGHPSGVVAWRPASELVVDLSDVLDGGPDWGRP